MPFFGHLLTAVPVQVVNHGLPTACVTNEGRYGTLKVLDAFVDGLTRAELTAVLMHEVLHLAFGAFPRMKHRNLNLWNQAHDYAINLIIDEVRETAKGLPLAWPKNHPPLLDQRFKGMTAEEIYDRLLREHGGGRGGSADGSTPSSGDPDFSDASDLVVVVEPGSEEATRQERALKNLLAEAVEVHRARRVGDLPAGLVEEVDASLRVHVPWLTQLVHKVEGRLHGGGVSYAHLSRRSAAIGIPIPGRSRRRPQLAVVLDTSGSVSKEELRIFLGAIRQLLEVNEAELRVIQVDAAVQKDEVVEDFDGLLNQVGKFEIRGRGGTNFDAVPACLEDFNWPIPNLAVLFTDGEPMRWPGIEEWPCEVVVVTTRTLPPEEYASVVFEHDEARA
jgi:predicted metal-dependent peptidase